MRKLSALALFFLVAPICGPWAIDGFCAETRALHGQSWAFGQSGAREDAIWKNGVNAGAIRKHATPEKGATDTSGGIDRAIKHAQEPKGKLGVSMSDYAGTWKTTPESKNMRPDENMFRDRSHVVRAFADMKPAEDLSIRVGPELILKDERTGSEAASESQPDSSLGVGMRFKYDF